MLKLATDWQWIPYQNWGVYPRSLSGLKGILTAPFFHADWHHLYSNAIPLLVLGVMMIYFYEELFFRAFLGIYLLSGFWLWLSGREAFHIGASGLVYGLSAFIFLSGILRRHTGLMAVSLIVVFLYGGLVWGLFPLPIAMSWEAHLSGLLAGFLMAFYYRKQGPQRPVYEWEEEEEKDENLHDTSATEKPENRETIIRYIYKPGNQNSHEKD